MDFKSLEYVKYLRIGEMAKLKIDEESGTFLEFTCIIAQVTGVSCELVIMFDEIPAPLIGVEIPATLSAMAGYLHCECPVIIGKNSFEQTAFARFSGEVDVKIQRNYIRQDVLVPFLYEPLPRFEKAKDLILSRRADPDSVTFTCEKYGESFKAVAWRGKDDLVPVLINLGGGGVRFATVDPFQRNTFLALQTFLDWPEPRVIHAVLKVIRSKPFEQTPEDRSFYNWAKIRLKSKTISITAGSYEYIEDEDRQFLVAYVQEMQSRNSFITVEGDNGS